MSHSTQLSTFLSDLKYKKLADKKLAINNILSLYKNQDVIKEINYNTMEDITDNVTWNQIMSTVQQIIIDEVMGKAASNRSRICNLVEMTFENSNMMLTKIDFSTVVAEILEKETYAYCHRMYINALPTYILPVYACRVKFSSDNWQNLLRVCVNLYPNQTSSPSKNALLKTIFSIVNYGCLESHLTLVLRKFLPVLEEIFKSANSDQILANSAFQLAAKVCQQIAIDERMELCDFAEKILPNIVFLEGREEKYVLFLILIEAHSPNGMTFNDPGFYARNPKEWRNILENMFSMIMQESRAEILSQPFIHFATAVFRQMSKFPTNEQLAIFNTDFANEYAQPTKKRRLNINGGILLHTVNEKETKFAWPMIQILANVLEKYPDTFDFNEFIELLRIVKQNFATLTENKYALDSLCQLAVNLLALHEKFAKQNKIVDLKNFTSEILNSLLRCLPSIENDHYGHILIQSLIVGGKVTNYDTLIRAFVTRTMKWSSNSVRTLFLLCRHVPLPEKITQTDNKIVSLKRQIIKWLLNIPWHVEFTDFPLYELGEILSCFPLKTWCKGSEEFKEDSTFTISIKYESCLLDSVRQLSLADINHCHVSQNLFTEEKKEKKKKTDIKLPIWQKDELEFIITEISHFLQEGDLKITSIAQKILKCMIVARTISSFELMNIENNSLPLLSDTLEGVFNSLQSFDFTKQRLKDLEVILNSLSVFFQVPYHDKVTEIILSSISQESLSYIYKILTIEQFTFDEYSQFPCPNINETLAADFPVKSSMTQLPKEAILKLKVTRTLKNYASLTVGSKMNEIQQELMRSLIRNNNSEMSTNVDIKIATLILEVVNRDLILEEDILDYLIDYLLLLYSTFHRNSKIVRYVLKILPIFYKQVTKIGLFSEKFQSILLEIDRSIQKQLYGSMVHWEFLKSIGKMFEIDATFKSLSQDISVIELILNYVESPFFIVRQETAMCVYKIFSSHQIDFTWKKYFYEKLMSIIINEKEENLLRSLSIFAAIISGNNKFQNRILQVLLKLKNIPTEMIKKLLKIGKFNHDFLLLEWCSNKTFDTFPWSIIDSSCESKFSDIIHILLVTRNLNFHQIIEYCEKLKINFSLEYRKSFPKICAWLLFYIARGEKWAGDLLEQLKNNMSTYGIEENFATIGKENLDQLIVHLLQGFDDEENFERIFHTSVTFSESIPMRLKLSEIETCFNLLENELLDSRLIKYLMNNGQVLQKILMSLTCNIYESRELKAFHQYVYFSSLLLEELKGNSLELEIFLIRDISYTLLHLMKTEFLEFSCSYFDRFLREILPEKSERIKEFFPIIVRTLTPLVDRENSIALSLLNFLIVEQRGNFSDCIKKLNSFPNSSYFQEIRQVHESYKTKYTLANEINDFLHYTEEINLPSNVSSLLLLKGKILKKKNELNELYKTLENLRFAEDSDSSILHQLIYRLVKLSESSDLNVSQEAVKCLGILGPGDLTTMILHQEKMEIRESNDRFETLTYKILIFLSNHIIDENIELRKSSTTALYSVVNSSWGAKLMNAKYRADFERNLHVKEIRLCMERIRPFIIGNKTKNRLAIERGKFRKLTNLKNHLWKEQVNISYFDWICELTCSIAEIFTNFYLQNLIPIFRVNLQFCEEILYRIVNIIIRDDATLAHDFCNCINEFFRSNSKMEKFRNHDSIRYMLNLVNFLRIQDDGLIALKFDYLPIAKAAQLCSAYFTSIMYVELWCENFLNGKREIESSLLIDRIYQEDPIQGKIVKDIIRDASLKIGDPDAVFGCGTYHLKDREARLQYFADLQQWDQMVVLQDSKLTNGHDSLNGMMSALENSGYQYLLGQFIKTTNKGEESSEIDDFHYECAWRLANWNCVTLKKNCENSENSSDFNVDRENFSYHHYKCLKSFHEDDFLVLKSSLESARSIIIKDLRNISSESCKAVYPSLTKLRMLQEIEDLSLVESQNYEMIISDWKSQDYIRQSEFQYIEPLLWQRSVLCKIQDNFKNIPVLKESLIEVYLEIAEIASKQGFVKEASRSLGTLAKEDGLSFEIRDQLNYQESLLAWMNKDEGLARLLLRNLLNQTKNNYRLHAESLRVYGNWMAETQSGNRQTILKKYLEAIKIFMKIDEPSSQDLRNLNKTQAALARFADVHYRQLKDYMQSSDFDSMRKMAEMSLDSHRNELAYQDRDVRIAFAKNKRQTAIDALSLEETEKEKNYYLTMALQFYVKTLRQSEEHNFIIFRVVSLWLDNIALTKINEILDEYLPTISSYKFIQMLPQLAAHMSDEDDEFSMKINNILERCALDHPFHSLPVLLALKHLYEDTKFTSKGTKHNKIEARVVGAIKLIQKLSKSNKISGIVREMEQLALALVQLAYAEIPPTAQKCNIPRGQDILKVKNFENAIVPTITMDVRPNKNYEDVIGVSKYLNTFEYVGGINAPKKIICVGTDGIERIQLVKGKDDLRQDAVMQQVFSVMNLLLKARKETKQRKLVVRTYKVVPLTQRSGILEWCENTKPIQEILIGTNKSIGIHKKYYPNDYSVAKCRAIMEGSLKRPNDFRLQAYMNCCKHITPAFHHFFIETYLSPETWFERRLAYTRSVAVTSIVGYILGIGDRHLCNILLDKITAEVIHIDFGIAFEQGKVLPVPELIPFRLTRDIEVAMGISGVEGVMRRCCEQTMKVLREQKEVIVTLLQVLLYDPLFTWAITPSSMCRSSNSIQLLETDLEINKIAERALVRVQQKLTGMEEAVPSSIEGQIERLIQQARDPALLSRLYFGWQAYL